MGLRNGTCFSDRIVMIWAMIMFEGLFYDAQILSGGGE
jgi:hypothetical protein